MVRFKNRYLVVVVRRVDEPPADEKRKKKRQRTAPLDGDAWLSARDLHAALTTSIAANFGEWGAGISLSALAVRHLDEPTGVAIVRVARDALVTTRAALTFVTALRSGAAVVAQVVRVCGSMRTCRPATLAAVRRRHTELGVADGAALESTHAALALLAS